MIEVKAKAKNVLFVPGNVFMVDDTQPCSYIRSSYSIATPEQMDLVSISFLETVKKSRQISQILKNIITSTCIVNWPKWF